MIDKIKDSQLNNESHIIFDYFHVIKLFSDTHLKLFFKIYNYLFNPPHKYLFSINLKHAYLTILLYLNNKHYFAFTIFDIN